MKTASEMLNLTLDSQTKNLVKYLDFVLEEIERYARLGKTEIYGVKIPYYAFDHVETVLKHKGYRVSVVPPSRFGPPELNISWGVRKS